MDNAARVRLIVNPAVLLMFALTFTTVMPNNAHAAIYQETSRIVAVAHSTLDGTALWVAPIDTVNGSCNQAIYIPYEDKEMFAVALTASANKVSVDMFYDNAAPSKTLPYGTTTTISTPCRLKAINLTYVP